MSKAKGLLALISAADARDPRALSGTPYQMVRALERRGFEVDCLGPVEPFSKTVGRAINAATKRIAGRRFAAGHSAMLSRSYARFFRRRLSEKPYDLIIAPFASTEVARLRADIPLVYLSDLTFDLARDFYPSFTGLTSFSRRQAEEIERSAISRASLIIYPTRWAASSAVEHYGADPQKVRVVPFGANMEDLPLRKEVLPRRPHEVLRLLFVGVDWERKGGPIALEALRELRRSGTRAELIVCGCGPRGLQREEGLRFVPFVDKRDPRQRVELANLYRNSDILLLPTRAEAFGIVFGEAAAFGLPAISTALGGIPELVEEGKNGHLLPPSATGAEYARLIREISGDTVRYQALCEGARRAFEELYNWDAWGRAVGEMLEDMMMATGSGQNKRRFKE